MVKLSLVVGILALASSANAACDYMKCGTDYATAAGAAAGDMTKTCAATKTYVDCFNALTGCGTAEQMAVDMAKQAATGAMSQIESMCSGGSGGGGSGGSSSSTCDYMKCATDYSTAAQAAAGDMTKVCAATKGYVDCFGGLTECGAAQSAVDMAKQAATGAMSQIESMCSGGSGGGSTSSGGGGSTSSGGGSGGSSGNTCDMQKCASDYASGARTAAGNVAKTCDVTKAYVACFDGLKDCGAMQSGVDTAKASAKKTMAALESTCGSSSTDTGAASSTQVSAAVLVAAVAFVGMAN